MRDFYKRIFKRSQGPRRRTKTRSSRRVSHHNAMSAPCVVLPRWKTKPPSHFRQPSETAPGPYTGTNSKLKRRIDALITEGNDCGIPLKHSLDVNSGTFKSWTDYVSEAVICFEVLKGLRESFEIDSDDEFENYKLECFDEFGSNLAEWSTERFFRNPSLKFIL